MHFTTAAIAAFAGAAAAAPTVHYPRSLFNDISKDFGKIGTTVSHSNTTNSTSGSNAAPAGGFKSVVYWGQSQNKPLEEVCKEQVDTVVLSFINEYGNSTVKGSPSGNPGWQCAFGSDDSWAKSQCEVLGKNVTACQKAGKKVLMSIGGWIDYSLLKDGKEFGDQLYKMFGPGGNALGDGVTLDGYDFDIEHDNDNDKLAAYVDTVKELRAKAGGKQIITGAPMCVPPSQNVMTDLMKDGQFDELYFQFYNNAPCGANNAKGAADAWDQWVEELAGGASKSAKMYLGLLGGKDAGMSEYFIDGDKMTSLVSAMEKKKQFAGVMTWDAGYSMNTTTSDGNFLDSVSKALGRK